MRSKTRVQFWLEGHLFLFFGLVFVPLVFAWVILDLADSQNRLAYETRVQQAEERLAARLAEHALKIRHAALPAPIRAQAVPGGRDVQGGDRRRGRCIG